MAFGIGVQALVFGKLDAVGLAENVPAILDATLRSYGAN